MSDLEMWTLVVGFFSPVLIGVVQQPKWSNSTRSVVAFGICSLIGAGTAWVQGDLTGHTIVSRILIVLVTAISTYKGFWQPTGIVPSIESATSPQPKHKAEG